LRWARWKEQQAEKKEAKSAQNEVATHGKALPENGT